MPVESPCVACCKLNADDICTGCYRSLAEIANWRVLDEAARQQAVTAAKQRASQYVIQTEQKELHAITRAKCLAAQDPTLWPSSHS